MSLFCPTGQPEFGKTSIDIGKASSGNGIATVHGVVFDILMRWLPTAAIRRAFHRFVGSSGAVGGDAKMLRPRLAHRADPS
ncbi:hypothetical protein [Bradyrhizobium cosmicum]|uniref:hypothetical protein n=1 Tax=Bradyrhizobium cosmicum TaxID=1404864 RepID=UPI001181AE77|nr:hypothetical protein [Bradyrhizobium cosmicum]